MNIFDFKHKHENVYVNLYVYPWHEKHSHFLRGADVTQHTIGKKSQVTKLSPAELGLKDTDRDTETIILFGINLVLECPVS